MKNHPLCRVTQYFCFISRCAVIARITFQRNQNLIWRPIIAFSRDHSNGYSSLIFVQYFLKIGKWGNDLGKALPALYLRAMKQCISLEDSWTLKFLFELQLNMMSRVYLWCSRAHTHTKDFIANPKERAFWNIHAWCPTLYQPNSINIDPQEQMVGYPARACVLDARSLSLVASLGTRLTLSLPPMISNIVQ